MSDDHERERVEIELLLQGLYAWRGYDFRNYAYPSLRRRIHHRMDAEKCATVSALQDKIFRDPACLLRLVADFSIHVTEMFRDPLFFRSFRERVIPLLRTYPSIRIWHAGCSSVEEVYSMAILLHEEGLLEKTKIYATDIQSEVLKTAKTGMFPIEQMKRFTANYIKAGGTAAFSDYYNVEQDSVKFHSYLSNNMIFAQHNLAVDDSFNEFHVIICRNVMIYFNKELQDKVLDLFDRSLSMFGVLGLGDKETIRFTELEKRYDPVASSEKLYKKTKQAE